MFKINNTELRNLEEQVQKNKEDIANHYAIDRALANLGIKVVGQVTSADQLPNPLTYTGEYGDTYAVGNKIEVDAGTSSYEYYVYTRPDLNAGQPDNYWLNVGKISIAGPQGVQGPKGEKGDTGKSTKWYTGSEYPVTATVGDMYLNNAGEVFYFGENGWEAVVNIKGPQGSQGIRGLQGPQGAQGEQGPKGDTGDVGGFINIIGILTNEGQLPLPATLNNLTAAYLVGDNKDLYIQVGETSDVATWNNVGPFNAATLVMVNGIGQNVWDSDTKLDKYLSGGASRAYGTDRSGNQKMFQIYDTTDLANATQMVPLYFNKASNVNYGSKMSDPNAVLITAEPNQPYQAANKKYADENFVHNAPAMADPSGRKVAYGADKDGNIQYFPVGSGAGCIPQTNAYGLLVGSWEVFANSGSDNTYTPKKYVDDKFVARNTTVGGNRVYASASQGDGSIKDTTFGVQSGAVANTIPVRGAEGVLGVGYPTASHHATTKQYVDEATVLHQITLTMYASSGNDEIEVKFNIYSTNPNPLTDGWEEDPYGFVEQYLRPATPVLLRNPLEPAESYLADMVATVSDTGNGIVYFATLKNSFDRATEITDEIW